MQVLMELPSSTDPTASAGGASSALWRRFEVATQRNSSRVAVADQYCRLTYQELQDDAGRLAAHFARSGLGCGDIIGLVPDRGVSDIVGIFGILGAGAAYLPIDPTWPIVRTLDALRTSRARAIVGTPAATAGLDLGVIWSDGDARTRLRLARLDADGGNGQEHALAYVLLTSGSTGEPKAAMLEQQGVLHLVDSLDRLILRDHGPGLNIAMLAPYAFDPSIQQIFSAVLLGHTLHIIPDDARRDATALAAFLIDRGIDVCDGTPAHLKILACAPAAVGDWLPLRHLLIGGDVLHFQDIGRFFDRFPKSPAAVTNLYGVAECTVDSAIYPVQRGEQRAGTVPIGVPLGQTRIRVLDAQLRPVPNGALGEICIGGAGVGRGYVGDPRLTTAKYIADPLEPGQTLFRTGDLGAVGEDGMLHLRGRLDDQIKLRGVRIDPTEIEAHLKRLSLATGTIRDAAVVKDDAERLVAYLVASGSIVESTVRRQLARVLPPHMVPARLATVCQLPLTTHGKIDRQALARLAKSKRATASLGGSGLAAWMADRWQRLLELDDESLDPDADFFELGGHSILAAALLSEIEDTLQVSLSFHDLVRNSTLGAIIRCIERGAPPRIPTSGQQPLEGLRTLSTQQRRLYLLHQLEPESLALNIGNVLHVARPFERERLNAALAELVRRHENLRSSFVFADGDVRRMVGDAAPAVFEYNLPASELTAARQDLTRPFDVSRGPLVRVGVLATDEGFYLLLDLHHLVADGPSLTIIERELLDLYMGHGLSPLRLSFADYTAWHDKLLTLNRNNEVGRFWRQELAFRKPLALMPQHTNRQKEAGATIVDVELDGVESKRLRAAARRLNSAPLSFFGSVYCASVFAVTGVTDIVFGTALSGRDRPELRAVVGPLSTVVPIRIRLDERQAFSKFVVALNRTVLKAHDNQHFEFEQLRPGVDRWAGPLYAIGLSVLETPGLGEDPLVEQATDSRIDTRPIEVPHFLDMNLEVFERSTSVTFRAIARNDSEWRHKLPALVAYYKAALNCLSGSDFTTENENSTVGSLVQRSMQLVSIRDGQP